jgi:tetratricopeptide (TPR) repeat protein
MRVMVSKHLIIRLALAWGLALGAAAAEPAADRLRQAWEEYGFQNWSAADRLFEQTLAAPDSTPAQQAQARFGRAFIVQNRLPGRAPEKAIPLYEQLLRDLPAGDPLATLAQGCLGACHMDKKPADYEKARTCFRAVLERSDPARSIVAQDAAVRMLATYLKRPDPAEFRRGLAEADAVLPRLAGTPLAGTAHGFAAQMALCLNDLRRFEAELTEQDKAGIESRAVHIKVLFQIARLNEMVLKDYAKAARYYRRLHDEFPSAGSAYFAGLRAAELDAGRLNSAYAPPLVPDAPDASVPKEAR